MGAGSFRSGERDRVLAQRDFGHGDGHGKGRGNQPLDPNPYPLVGRVVA
jgi:hypothetical protein